MDRVPLSQRSVAELRAQATGYRRIAERAHTKQAFTTVLRLADRFDALAEQRGRNPQPIEARP
jgi:hypothetical protein